ncbi:MAG: beta-N-acetylhexosaminidase [Lentisphaerae bacterium]|nr:beta-N-acetylhexosaminidase [Lentisphaerota bacterium]
MNSLLIPVRKHRALSGSFTWPATVRLCSSRDVDALPLDQLAADLKRLLQRRSSRCWQGAGEGDVVIRRDPAVRGREAYRLTVQPDGVEIKASTDRGAYYAIQTLRDLVVAHGATLPCCRIDDSPDFERRGVYYDVARGKVPHVETLKALIERLAHWKLNEFQIYIKNTFTWRAHPDIGKGFSSYTPQDILDIQAHCRLHHMRFVPSLATLSHNELILQLPAYRHLAEKPGVHGWEGGTMLCPTDPKAFRLTQDLYNEFVPLFEADDINVCCDEPWELGQGRSKRAADRIGRGRVYLNYLLKLHAFCAKRGKRMNVWGDIVLKYPELIPEFPKDVVMLNWDYAAKGTRIPETLKFADAGLPVMVCPGTSSWQRHGTDLPNAIGNVSNFARTGRRCGVEGMLNTDWGDFGHRNPLGVSLHGYAHGAAHAWHGHGVDDATFTQTFAQQVFGDSGALADAIRVLGATAGQVHADSRSLYHALVEPIRLPVNRFVTRFRRVSLVGHYPDQFPNMISQGRPEALEDVIDRLTSPTLWPDATANLPEFETQALADYRLASAMDVLAAERSLIGQSHRAGCKVSPAELNGWADAMTDLMAGFEGLWCLRFRPSKLADNLKLMRLAAEECRQLAGRS